MAAGENFDDRPFGGYQGEWLGASTAAEPPPPAPAPLAFEPPPWQAQLEAGVLDPALLAPPGPSDRVDAIAAMRIEAGEEPEPVPIPMLPLPPLERPTFPPPDWRAEMAEAEAAARLGRETEPDDQSYPAKPRRQP